MRIAYRGCVRSFYSRLVRLEVYNVPIKFATRNSFLFQIGSIRGLLRMCPRISSSCFYSRLVRLEEMIR